MPKRLKPLIHPIWLPSQRVLLDGCDYVQRLLHGQGHLPPLSLRDVGPSDFVETGQEFLNYFVELGGLQPGHAVLEIGCGSGRMALPLINFLDPTEGGSYVGLDVVAPAINWCQRHIAARHPHFAFQHLDIFNRRYNPGGRMQARTLRVPFPDSSFDFIFLTSVFTHLLPEDSAHYLHECSRLLRPGGRIFSTWLLLNATQAELAAQGQSDINLAHERDGYRIRDQAVPESAVGVDEELVRGFFDRAGLVVDEPIHYGRWSGRVDALSYQDLLLARREGRPSP